MTATHVRGIHAANGQEAASEAEDAPADVPVRQEQANGPATAEPSAVPVTDRVHPALADNPAELDHTATPADLNFTPPVALGTIGEEGAENDGRADQRAVAVHQEDAAPAQPTDIATEDDEADRFEPSAPTRQGEGENGSPVDGALEAAVPAAQSTVLADQDTGAADAGSDAAAAASQDDSGGAVPEGIATSTSQGDGGPVPAATTTTAPDRRAEPADAVDSQPSAGFWRTLIARVFGPLMQLVARLRRRTPAQPTPVEPTIPTPVAPDTSTDPDAGRIDLSEVPGWSCPPVELAIEPGAEPLDEDPVAAVGDEIRSTAAWYARASTTFLGRVADTVARSLDQSSAAIAAALVPVPQPNLDFLAADRRSFQRSVWRAIIVIPVGGYLIMRFGDPLVNAIASIPRVPSEAGWNPGGLLTTVADNVQSFFSRKESWVLVLALVMLWWAWRRLKAYWRSDLRALDLIRDYEVQTQNQVRALTHARHEHVRLTQFTNAYGPLAEILAWIIHEPTTKPADHGAEPGGDDPEHSNSAGSTEMRLPFSVRFGDLTLSERHRRFELRTAVEGEAGPGFLNTVLLDAAEAVGEDLGLKGSEVLDLLARADAAGTGRDVRHPIRLGLSQGVLQVRMRNALAERVRRHRAALISGAEGTGLAEAEVTDADGDRESVAEFTSGILGPASAFVSDLWTAARQVDGAHRAKDAADVAGEFQTYVWRVPLFADRPEEPNGVAYDEVDVEVLVTTEEIVVASIRLDLMQAEPIDGLACFAPAHKGRSGGSGSPEPSRDLSDDDV